MIVQLTLFDPIPIQLTKGYTTFVDPIDADLANYKWKVSARKDYYALRIVRTGINHRTTIQIHRVILARMLNRELLPGEIVDHINGDTLNNCRANLRLANHSTNRMNAKRRSDNKSGYKGVAYKKRDCKWYAYIAVNGARKHLGTYDSPLDAYAAYCEAAKCYYGEFARFE